MGGGKYVVKVWYIGYSGFLKEVGLSGKNGGLNVGKVELGWDGIMVGEGVVVGEGGEVRGVGDRVV